MPQWQKLFFRREYPTLTWGKPKPPKAPKVKQEKARVVKRAAKKVLRKRIEVSTSQEYAIPCRLSNDHIYKLAKSYKFLAADDPEIAVLLDDMHGTNSGSDMARSDKLTNPEGNEE